MAVVFRESGNVEEGLNSIWRAGNDVGSRDGRQICEELFPCRFGQSGTSLLALSFFWNLMSHRGISFDSDCEASSPIWDVRCGSTCFVKSAVDSRVSPSSNPKPCSMSAGTRIPIASSLL